MSKVCALLGLLFCCLLPAGETISLKGRVAGPEGRFVAGAVVALAPLGEAQALSGIPEVRTDRQGAFTLSAPVGKFGFTVTAPGCLPHSEFLELKDGMAPAPLKVRLERGGLRVRGRILSEGADVPGLRLAFCAPDSRQFFARLQGRDFDISLAPGNYQARAEARGQAGNRSFEVQQPLFNAFLQLHPLPTLPTQAPPEVRDWIARSALPLKGVEPGQGFEDLQPLKALVGEATVVGLGEATHGSREFFQLKHRMLEFLVEEMGFTVFALEANLPEAFAVNEFVLEGTGDPVKALAGLRFWTCTTEELLALIRWMRTYNENPAHPRKLRFYGVDMQNPDLALADTRAWLASLDLRASLRFAELERRLRFLPRARMQPLPEAERRVWMELAEGFQALLEGIQVKDDGSGAFDRQRQELRVLAQFSRMQGTPGRTAIPGSGARDEFMAENLRWIQAREGGAKAVLWAHNLHVSRLKDGLVGADPLGWHLRRRLGAAYLPVGFAFQQGAFQAKEGPRLSVFEVKARPEGTLDGALASPGHAVLALDLRRRPGTGPVKAWLEAPQGSWCIGATFQAEQAWASIQKGIPTEAYDALLFVRETTAARPVGGQTGGAQAASRKAE